MHLLLPQLSSGKRRSGLSLGSDLKALASTAELAWSGIAICLLIAGNKLLPFPYMKRGKELCLRWLMRQHTNMIPHIGDLQQGADAVEEEIGYM